MLVDWLVESEPLSDPDALCEYDSLPDDGREKLGSLPDSLAELDCDSLSDWLDSDNDSDTEDSEFAELAIDGWLKLLELPESELLESELEESLDSDADDEPEDWESDELAELELVPMLGLLMESLDSLSLCESLESDWLLLSDDPLDLLDAPLPEDEAELELEPTDETESETDDSEPDDFELSLDD